MELLNIGCGDLFHPAWNNIDLISVSPHVKAHDLRKKLPYDPETFDAVYHSHLLEHLKPNEAVSFLAEARRVLKKGGVMRTVIPDLEDSARLYIKYLDSALNNETGADEKYEWMVIELIDQLTRTTSGGVFREFVIRDDLKQLDFITSRAGQEIQSIRNSVVPIQKKSFFQKLMTKSLRWYFEKIKYVLAYFFLTLIGGKSFRETFKEGRFRRSGEVHQWMYDRYSIKKLLERNGFEDVKILKYNKSQIPSFETYALDSENGVERKPSSLFVECRKI